MKTFTKTLFIIFFFGYGISVAASFQKKTKSESHRKEKNFVFISEQDTPEQIIQKAAHVIPSARQLEWQKLEYTAFVHFGLYTYQKEGGDPKSFNPVNLNCRQWVKSFKDAGMKGVILTAKHHEGFCLWPSQYADYSVKNSVWKNGKGDVVKELSDACKEYGLKLGIYLSPWDMHNPDYGTPKYDEYFKNQLTELLTNYGDIFEVWFDGAYRGLKEEKHQYDWKGYVDLIRKIQPNATIAIMGPDVRWVGTETGYGRETEWSVVPARESDLIPVEYSLEGENERIFTPASDMVGKDLGSREKISKAKALVWYPSEVDVSIRPSWGYSSKEDSLVKSPEKLMDIYYSSIGRNSLLLLNIPVNKDGLIHANDIKALLAFREIRENTFKTNLLEGSKIEATNSKKGFEASKIFKGKETYWTTSDGISTGVIEFNMKSEKTFDRLLVQENIINGQRVESFSLDIWKNNEWIEQCRATTIGYKRILRFSAVTSARVRLKITSSRDCPEILNVGLYKSPKGI